MKLSELEGKTILKVVEIPAAGAIIILVEGGLRIVVNDAEKMVYHA